MSPAERLIRPELLAADEAQPQAMGGDAWPDDAIRLHSGESPYPPLVEGALAAGANRFPEGRPAGLERALAALYGVASDSVLAVRDVEDGADRLIRAFSRPGKGAIGAEPGLNLPLADLAALHGVRLGEAEGANRLCFASAAGALILAEARRGALVAADESFVEFGDLPSLAPQAAGRDDLVVLRSLSSAYGLAGAKVGAVIAHPRTIALLARAVPRGALPSPSVAAALAVLTPSRRPAHQARIAAVLGERARLAARLAPSPDLIDVQQGDGPFVLARAREPEALAARLKRQGVRVAFLAEGALRIGVGAPAEIAALLSALGHADLPRPTRRGELVRDTGETRIAVAVDLDSAEPRCIDTGVAFFDHMLDQVAAHGGFALTLACEGDLAVDAHHTIEDCALALGAALSKALGERRGIGRFGFSLPMDEAEGRVLIDLSGRPFDVFEGEFSASHIGSYPTQMTAHVFRSLSQSLGAAIHVRVTGENDHHKTEAAFKAFGRALRTAIARTIEAGGDAGPAPSTKGVL